MMCYESIFFILSKYKISSIKMDCLPNTDEITAINAETEPTIKNNIASIAEGKYGDTEPVM